MDSKHGMAGLALAMLACGVFCADAWATCSSTLSGTTAAVTCSQNTDSLTISQSSGYWYHTGPAIGGSIYDWNSAAPGTQYLPAGGTVEVNFPAGAKLHIGNSITPAYALDGAVGITNPASSGTQVFFDAATGAAPATYTIDDEFGVVGVGQLLFDDSSSAGLQLIVNAGTADDVVYVRSVCSCDTVLLQGTAGADAVYFGRNGSTQLIGGAVTVRNDAGFSQVTIDDHADAAARTAVVANTGVTGIAPAAILWNYFDVGSILLTMGTAADTVIVSSLENPLDASSITIEGTAGADAVIVRDDTNGAQAIRAPVLVRNSGGFSEVEVVDTSDTLPRSATLTATGIYGLAPAAITWVPTQVSSLVMRFGSGGDTVHVLGTPPKTQDATLDVVLYLDDGENRCYVNGGGLGVGTLLTINGGAADDLFVASAVPIGAGLSINGGTQAAGDKLVYTSGPATGAFPGNGALDPVDPAAAPIFYNSIELFSIDDWIFSSGFE